MVDELLVELLRGSETATEWIDEGRRQMTRTALEGRFGTLDAGVIAALDHAQEETLRDIVGHVSTDTVAQTRARLGLS